MAVPIRQADRLPGGPWEPQMGANAISRPPTQRDPVRTFTEVKDSRSDSARR